MIEVDWRELLGKVNLTSFSTSTDGAGDIYYVEDFESAKKAPVMTYTPLQRRRNVGDSCKAPDQDGFYILVTSDKDGIPKESVLLVVENGLWWWMNDPEDKKVLESLPKRGIYVFLY